MYYCVGNDGCAVNSTYLAPNNERTNAVFCAIRAMCGNPNLRVFFGEKQATCRLSITEDFPKLVAHFCAARLHIIDASPLMHIASGRVPSVMPALTASSSSGFIHCGVAKLAAYSFAFSRIS